MGPGAQLVLQLSIVALEHAAELQQLLQTAVAAGRDVTPDELAAIRLKSLTAVAALATALSKPV